MHYSLRRPWLLLLVLFLCSLLGETARSEPLTLKELNARPDEVAFQAYFNQIGSLSGKYVLYDAQDQISETHTFLWDSQRDYFNGTMVKSKKLPGDRSDISVWVFGPDAEWTATSVVTDLKDPGAMFVNVNPSTGGGRPRAISRSIFNVDLISVMHKPFHLRVPSSDVDASHRRIELNEVLNADGVTSRCYDVFRGTRKASRLEYLIDKRDGLRLFSSTLIVFQDDKSSVEFSGKYGDHIKNNGMWYPRTVEEMRVSYDNTGPVKTTIKLRMLEVNVNPALNDKSFVYKIPYGSRVSDERTGLLYLSGYSNPNRASGTEHLPDDFSPRAVPETRTADKVNVEAHQSDTQSPPTPANTESTSTSASVALSIPGLAILLLAFIGVCSLLILLWRRR